VVKKVMPMAENLIITNVDGNIVFKVFTLRDHRVLVDAAGNTIITLRPKVCSTLFSLPISYFFYLITNKKIIQVNKLLLRSYTHIVVLRYKIQW